MMPIGPLMVEHRLIERMIKLMENELQKIRQSDKVNTDFLGVAVDFLKVYADRCHHGKEEDILFGQLHKKDLSAEHKRILGELIKEHEVARNNVRMLSQAIAEYRQGDVHAIGAITEHLQLLVDSYPKHIEKEDKHFFMAVMRYFTKEEQAGMLAECWEFDRKLIHEKYHAIVEAWG